VTKLLELFLGDESFPELDSIVRRSFETFSSEQVRGGMLRADTRW
jgi:hypothetical protein